MDAVKPQRRTVGRITVPADAWERIFGSVKPVCSMCDGEGLIHFMNMHPEDYEPPAPCPACSAPKPNPEVAEPGQWVDVTCRNHECPEFEQYETSVGEPVYDVLPPSCPRCGHELEAI